VAEAGTRVDTPEQGVPYPVRVEILTAYEEGLRVAGNPIHGDPHALQQALRQANAVIDDVNQACDCTATEPQPEAAGFTLDVGADRAQRGVHPFQSLRAAMVLFDVALPPLIRALTDSRNGPDAIAIALHQSIMSRVAIGSLSYVGFLMDRVYSSHLEERRRIARELHDRVAHAIGVGLQHLDLHRIYREREEHERASTKLRQVSETMREAMSITRGLSEELRQSVGPRGLVAAMRSYLETNVPPNVDVVFDAGGEASDDAKAVPTEVAEEIYVVLREAVRNALLHSGTDRLSLSLVIDRMSVTATVTDFGTGFEGRPEDLRTGGLLSMRERVEIIGGSLSISDSPAGGTTVALQVPLAGDSA
jgi:signal transduction histidine kinase